MIPKAKKNLHACKYHLDNLKQSKHFEELEINFAAFVNSARNTTFVLQKEFGDDPRFIEWYGDIEKHEIICESCGKKKSVASSPKEGTKQYQMKNDDLCKFFTNLRNKIIKEGINNLSCSTKITQMHSVKDFPDRPPESKLIFGSQGAYYLIKEGTSEEDKIPAVSKTAKIMTEIYIAGAPSSHLGREIKNPNLLTIAELYYDYIEGLVEEWTEIINK